MKTLLIAMMLGSTAMTGVALAQTTTAPVTNATEPTDTASQMEGGIYHVAGPRPDDCLEPDERDCVGRRKRAHRHGQG